MGGKGGMAGESNRETMRTTVTEQHKKFDLALHGFLYIQIYILNKFIDFLNICYVF